MKVHINEAASIVYNTQIERFNSKSINVNSAALLLLFSSSRCLLTNIISFSLLFWVDKMRLVQSQQLLRHYDNNLYFGCCWNGDGIMPPFLEWKVTLEETVFALIGSQERDMKLFQRIGKKSSSDKICCKTTYYRNAATILVVELRRNLNNRYSTVSSLVTPPAFSLYYV